MAEGCVGRIWMRRWGEGEGGGGAPRLACMSSFTAIYGLIKSIAKLTRYKCVSVQPVVLRSK